MNKTFWILALSVGLAACSQQADSGAVQTALAVQSAPQAEMKEDARPVFARQAVFKQKDCLQGAEYCTEIDIETVTTGLSWLDKALQQAQFGGADGKGSLAQAEREWPQRFRDIVAEQRENMKEEISSGGWYENQRWFDLGGRGHTVFFALESQSYTGGAHGMYDRQLFVADLAAQKLLKAADIVESGKLPQLQERLNAAYDDYILQQAEVGESPAEILREHKKSFTAEPGMDNFLFTADGLQFVYPPYALNNYAAGEVRLTLPWEEVRGIVKNVYNWRE